MSKLGSPKHAAHFLTAQRTELPSCFH